MSKAYKCDSCGKLVEKAIRNSASYISNNKILVNYKFTKYSQDADICEECEVKLIEATANALKLTKVNLDDLPV